MVEKKVWAEPDFNLEWIEKSTRWKKKYGPNQTSTQPILVDEKSSTVEKKVWAEPDRLSLFWWIEKKKKTRYKASGNITECEILV